MAGPAVFANETALSGLEPGPVHSRACHQDAPRTASALLLRSKKGAGQALQVGTPFGRSKRVHNSHVQPQSTVLEISLFRLKNGSSFSKISSRCRSISRLSASLKPGAWLWIVSRPAVTFVGVPSRSTQPLRALPSHSIVCERLIDKLTSE